MKKFFLTGGAGFIGSEVVRFLMKETDHKVLNYDKLTYAGNLESLSEVSDNTNYQFVHGDIADYELVNRELCEFQPDVIMNLAAESHVDRSIDGPTEFIQTNVVGTSVLLEAARNYWSALPAVSKSAFRFHHISTDEVYGSLGELGFFTEQTAYNPSSPYSASKASSDHLIRSWHRTYGLPVLITNCSNNYGPFQFPEKLIPLMILNALEGKSLPVYGNGQQVRDWLHVEDHAQAIYKVVMEGKVGETYNIGGNNEKTNLTIVQSICELLDELLPRHPQGIKSYKELITFVADRPGHDQRYAIDSSKIQRELGWAPKETISTGLRKTVDWYLNNSTWCKSVLDGSYMRERLGIKKD